MTALTMSLMRTVTIRKLASTLAAAGVTLSAATPAFAAGDAVEVPRQPWSFAGFFGRYDAAQLQRGYQVYQEVCSNCHGIKRVYFRNLAEAGGPGFPEDRLKSLVAAKFKVDDAPNDQGKVLKRAALLSDAIPAPFKNDKEARSANGGSLPPDLSVITKARSVEYIGPWYLHPFAMLRDIGSGYQEHGPDYVYALLTGYGEAPLYKRDDKGHLVKLAKGAPAAGAERCASITPGEKGKPDECVKVANGMNYNVVFPGHQIAMPMPPFPTEKRAKYPAGVTATVEQQARDVVAFLAWTADPSLNQRKQMGMLVMIYLLITAVLLYLAKKKLWSRVH
ncbi:MAG TPA: cytochrome c1 [Hyphomicrobiaceae bacterium]|nr:cytochrome c1 [Hyphomicrobiaceae bacterium]